MRYSINVQSVSIKKCQNGKYATFREARIALVTRLKEKRDEAQERVFKAMALREKVKV